MSDFTLAVDPKDEATKQKEKRYVELRKVDGKLVARYTADNGTDYASYEKIFPDMKEFTNYTDKFLELN